MFYTYRRSNLVPAFFAGLLAAFISTEASASPDCAAAFKDTEKVTREATASAFSNVRKAEGSLRYESGKMLNEANAKLSQAAAPSGFCPEGCEASKTPRIVFSSVPKKYLSDYSDSKKCEDLLQKTKDNPIKFSDRKFSTQEEFNAWFGDFSQGKGTDGNELYKLCDGACSPRYTCFISQKDGHLNVDAEAICGTARDKNDNLYVLSYSYRFFCEASK